MHRLEGVKVTRVACGSSHSICWTTQDSQTSNVHEPVLFSNSKDPLGTFLVSTKDLNNDNSNLASDSGLASSCRKSSRLSLSRILLSLESNASQQKALQHVGGGEAPACRGEVSSVSLSINTSHEDEDAGTDFYPVFVAPSSPCSSRTQSLPCGNTGED